MVLQPSYSPDASVFLWYSGWGGFYGGKVREATTPPPFVGSHVNLQGFPKGNARAIPMIMTNLLSTTPQPVLVQNT